MLKVSFVLEQIVRYRMARASAQLIVGKQAQIRSAAVVPQSGGRLSVGDGSIFAGRVSMDRPNAQITIGPRTFFGKSAIVAAESVEIGADVLVSWGVTIVDHNSHAIEFSGRRDDVTNWLAGQKDWSNVVVRPVRIGDKAWIGFGASILPGVTIGEGAVIGAASVVTKDVEPWTVVAGNPARAIRKVEPTDRYVADAPASHTI